MADNKEQDNTNMNDKNTSGNAKDIVCPKKDKDGNCLVPGVHSDSDPIGGG